MKQQKTYSLFCKEGKNWVRLSCLAFKLDVARRAFQTGLLAGACSGKTMMLRPAEDDIANEAGYAENMERLLGKGENR